MFQPVILEALIERYSKNDDLGEGRWITVGAEEGADGKKVGGQPVFISEDGKIKAGMGGKFDGQKIGEAFGKKGEGKAEAAKSEPSKSEPPKTPSEPAKQPSEPAKPKSFSSYLGTVKTSGYTKGERFEHKGQMYEVTSADKPYYLNRRAAEAQEDNGYFNVKPGWHQQYTAKPVDKNEAELKRDAAKQAEKDAAETKAREGQAKFDAVAKADGMSTAINWPAGVPQPQWEEVHNNIDSKFGRGNRYFVGEVNGQKVAKSTYNAYDDFRESYYFPESITQTDTAKKAAVRESDARELQEIKPLLKTDTDGQKKYHEAAVKFYRKHGELTPFQFSSEMNQRAKTVGLSAFADEAGVTIALKEFSPEQRRQLLDYVATASENEVVTQLQQRAKAISDEREAKVRKLGAELEPERLQRVLDNVRRYSVTDPEVAVEDELEEQREEQAKKAARQAKRSQSAPKTASRSGSSTKSASWAKLKSGAWGARVSGSVSKGDSITITAKDGRKQTKTVGKIVYDGGDYTLVEVYAATAEEAAEVQKYAARAMSAFAPVLLR